jgi:hypothetical protein
MKLFHLFNAGRHAVLRCTFPEKTSVFRFVRSVCGDKREDQGHA